ncbi:MAG: glycosyltransferase family 2 protein [Bacillota bacterium]
MSKDITVVMPAYNEGDRIGATLDALKKSKHVNRIVVIDDGSKDGTADIAAKKGAEVHRLEKNQGKGYALNYGIHYAVDTSEIVLLLDADLGDSAGEADKLISPIIEGLTDVTIARFPAASKKGGFGLVKKLARYGVKFYTGQMIYTSLSGQRAFKSDVLKKLGILPVDYGVEVGMTIDILRMGYRIQEVDVNMTHRETGRDLQGFVHRGKQFYQISKTLLKKYREV